MEQFMINGDGVFSRPGNIDRCIILIAASLDGVGYGARVEASLFDRWPRADI